MFVLVLLLGACTLWPAGDDPTGRRLRLEAEKVRVAVRVFKSEHGRLPVSIAELVPDKLTTPPPAGVEYVFRDGIPVLIIYFVNSWPSSMEKTDCVLDIDSDTWRCQEYLREARSGILQRDLEIWAIHMAVLVMAWVGCAISDSLLFRAVQDSLKEASLFGVAMFKYPGTKSVLVKYALPWVPNPDLSDCSRWAYPLLVVVRLCSWLAIASSFSAVVFCVFVSRWLQQAGM